MRVEPENDPVWIERGRWLIGYLWRPRTWVQICAEARRRHGFGPKLTRHIIAYVGPLLRYDGEKYRRIAKCDSETLRTR